jgi:signal peptidase I
MLPRAVTLLSLGLLLAWFVVLGPAPIGGPTTYVVTDGTSMEPTLMDGDLALMRRSDHYRFGDVVAFRIPQSDSGGLVIHRIVGGSAEDGFVTRGDNRSSDDPWRPRPDDIAGSLLLRVPHAGSWLTSVRDPIVIAPLAAGVTVFLVLIGGESAGGERPRPRGESAVARLSRMRRRPQVHP